jgi:hypothetical protein
MGGTLSLPFGELAKSSGHEVREYAGIDGDLG